MPKVTSSCPEGCLGVQLLDLVRGVGAGADAWRMGARKPHLLDLGLLGVGEDYELQLCP